tara:strand:+ start:619 stop:996 length:378 start_codon:yes stop_codon:yes gene_type:complete
MLFKDLYIKEEKLLNNNGSTITTKVKLNKDHPIYNGHFPNNPITPGVIIIQIIKEIVEEYLDDLFFLKKIINVKYISPINPTIHNLLIIEIYIQKEKDSIIVKSLIKFNNLDTAVKFRGIFIKKL